MTPNHKRSLSSWYSACTLPTLPSWIPCSRHCSIACGFGINPDSRYFLDDTNPFSTILRVTVGARTPIQKQSSSVFAGPSPHCMIRPVPGNGTLNRPAGGLEPPVQIDPGPHESVFNDSLWVTAKGKGLVRGGADTRASTRGPWGEISLTRHRCPSDCPSSHLCFWFQRFVGCLLFRQPVPWTPSRPGGP